MVRHRMLFGGLALMAALARTAAAQTGTVAGTVLRDSVGNVLGEAEIALPALKLGGRTNYRGEFRIDHVPAGRHAIVVRHVGFAPLIDSITVKDGQVFDGEFIMTVQAATLDSVRVVAAARPTVPFLQEFEARRKVGFGHFIAPDEIRTIDNHSFLNYLVTKLPGMRTYQAAPGVTYIASGRKPCGGPAFQCAGAVPCAVTLYIDGAASYISGVTNGAPPDFSSFKSDDYVAVEYYASGATAPSQYNTTGSDCGILLLWRRYR